MVLRGRTSPVSSFPQISFPHLCHFVSSLRLLSSLTFPSVTSLSQITLFHALVASASIVSTNALSVLSILTANTSLSPAETALVVVLQPHVIPSPSCVEAALAPAVALASLAQCLQHITSSAETKETLQELFDNWFLALSKDVRRSSEAVRFLRAAMKAGLSVEPLLIDLELLARAVTVASPLFDEYCALMASGGTEEDRRRIVTFVLDAPETAVSLLGLFERLPEKPTKSLVALFGTVAEGVARSCVATSLCLQDVLDVLAALALRERSLAAAAFASMQRGVVGENDGVRVVQTLVRFKMLERSFVESLGSVDVQVAFLDLVVRVVAAVCCGNVVGDCGDVVDGCDDLVDGCDDLVDGCDDANHESDDANAKSDDSTTTPILLTTFASSLFPPAGWTTDVEIRVVQLMIGLLSHDATAKPLQSVLEKNTVLYEYLVGGFKRSKVLVPLYLQLATLLPLQTLNSTLRKTLTEAIVPFASLRENPPSLVRQALTVLNSLCNEAACCPFQLNDIIAGFPAVVKLAEESFAEPIHLPWVALLRLMGALIQKDVVQSIFTDSSKNTINDTLLTSLPAAIDERNSELLSCMLPLLPACDFVTVDRSTLPARLSPLIPQWCQECEKQNEQQCLVALLQILMKCPQAENVIPDVVATLQHAYTSNVLLLVRLLPEYLATLRPFPTDLLSPLSQLIQQRNVTHLEPLLECFLSLSSDCCLPSLAPLLSSLPPSSRRVAYALLLKGKTLPPVDVSLLMRDAVGTDHSLALSAMDLLERLLRLSDRFDATLETMMSMEAELTV